MANKRLLNAPDLQSRQIYRKVDGKRILVAIVRSSKALGLEEREEIVQSAAAASADAARKEKNRNA